MTDMLEAGLYKSALLNLLSGNRGSTPYDDEILNKVKQTMGKALSFGVPLATATAGAYGAKKKGQSAIAGGLKGLAVGGPVGYLINKLTQQSQQKQDVSSSGGIRQMLALEKALHEAPDTNMQDKAKELNQLSPKLLKAYDGISEAKKKLMKGGLSTLDRRKHELEASKHKFEIEEMNSKIKELSNMLRGKMTGMAHMMEM